MSHLRISTTGRDPYHNPRVSDASLRRKMHGPIQPMEAPGFWSSLLFMLRGGT